MNAIAKRLPSSGIAKAVRMRRSKPMLPAQIRTSSVLLNSSGTAICLQALLLGCVFVFQRGWI